MFCVPKAVTPLRDALLSDFTRAATAQRVVFLMLAAILVTGNRTVANLLRLLAFVERFNPSTYHRVLSHRRWNANRLARTVIGFLLERYTPRGVVRLCGDETIDGHRGKKVYGKARHRDAVRSSHSYTAFRYGHKWIVLAMLVELPCCNRPFALPILVALYRDKQTNTREGRRHKTPVELMCGLLALVIRWFPERTWRFAGDGGYGTHEFARFAHRHRKRLTLVSKFFSDANLYKLPPKRKAGTNGRPRTKGAAMPKPADVVRRSKGKRLTVRWYGGGTRQIEVITGSGNWFKSGHGLAPVAWVHVRDLSGTHREEYFFTTDVTLSAKAIVEMYGARWNIETTFQEMRSQLGLETTRGWSRQTVLRMAPCLFVLYTIVAVFYDALRTKRKAKSPIEPLIHWNGKQHVAFADMIAQVRRHLWQEWVFQHVPGGHHLRKLPPATRKLLHYGLSQAA